MRSMKILFPMTYFVPYLSGPIVYVRRLGEELARRGHKVTVLTSQHDALLKPGESCGGIEVVRVPVRWRISKGVIMRGFLRAAWQVIGRHDLVVIQAPQFEAPLLALLARLRGTPFLVTYHCDVSLPRGAFNRLVEWVMWICQFVVAALSPRIVVNTEEYAMRSPVIRLFRSKAVAISPPVEVQQPEPGAVDEFRRRYGLSGRKVIGICGRLSREKGFEHLMDAVSLLSPKFPNLCVLHVGYAAGVPGEDRYRDRITELQKQQKVPWISAGVVSDEDLAAFYACCDVTVLPSINRTESFGIVQVESMISGTPVVASDLPGVRVPVLRSGMGKLVRPGDARELAEALEEILTDPERFREGRREVKAEYAVRRVADRYERLFAEQRHAAGAASVQ